MKFNLLISYAACLPLCIWQIYDVSLIYFSYSTTVDVRFDDDPVIELPAITIVADISKNIKENYLKEKFGKK